MTNPNEADIREMIAYTVEQFKTEIGPRIEFETIYNLRESGIDDFFVEFLPVESLPPGVERTLQVTVAGKKMTFDIYEPAEG